MLGNKPANCPKALEFSAFAPKMNSMIHVTESAARRIAEQLADRGHGLGLRVGVRKSGCSGFAYTMEFADALGEGDQAFESQGATVVVHADHLDFLGGTTVDYTRDGLNRMFTFDNPNVEDACGCGESFTVKAA